MGSTLDQADQEQVIGRLQQQVSVEWLYTICKKCRKKLHLNELSWELVRLHEQKQQLKALI